MEESPWQEPERGVCAGTTGQGYTNPGTPVARPGTQARHSISVVASEAPRKVTCLLVTRGGKEGRPPASCQTEAMLGDKRVSILPRSNTEVLNKEPKNGTSDAKVTTPPPVQRRDMGGRRCRVVFSYSPQHDDELPLCVGQTITILQEVEEGWWKGVLDGQDCSSQVGMFPSNFVEETEEEEAPGKEPQPTVETINNINNQLNVNGQKREIKPKPIQGLGYGVKLTDLKKEVKREVDQPHSQPSATTNGSAKILGSSTTSAFHPIHKDTPKENGQVKNFRDLPHKLPPALEPKAEKVTNKTDKTRINAADKERINSLEKDRISVNLQDDKPKVDGVSKREQPPATVSPAPPHTTPHTQLPPPQLPPKPVRELARVMFPYGAEHEDELELHEGDLITVLCKDLEDRGWWRGELSGRVGVFPDNFVELITIEEMTKPPRPEKPAAVLAKRSPSSSTDSTPTSTLHKNDKEPPPPLPEKKVPAPPPPEKKPAAPLSFSLDAPDSTLAPTTDDNTTMSIFSKKNNSHSRVVVPEPDETSSLSLDTEGEKLRHVTHLRPKGPSRRRPPSGIFKENMKAPNAESESPLPPTPEDEVDNDGGGGSNGRTELSRSPSVPTLSHETSNAAPRLPEVRIRPEPHPRPDLSPTTTTTVPWLQELGLKQKQKRLSGVHNQDGDGGAPAPPVSPKPTLNLNIPLRPDDKPTPKSIRPLSDASSLSDITSPKTRLSDSAQPTKPTTPHIPTIDYDHKPFTPQPPSTKTKPLPNPHQAQAPTEGKRYLPQVTLRQPSPSPQPSAIPHPSASPDISKKPSPETSERKNSNKTLPPPDTSSHFEEKIDALSKDFLQKMKHLEERLEEQRREQMRRMQMLMNELDEERKKRACMEVEMERLKKMVDAYAQV